MLRCPHAGFAGSSLARTAPTPHNVYLHAGKQMQYACGICRYRYRHDINMIHAHKQICTRILRNIYTYDERSSYMRSRERGHSNDNNWLAGDRMEPKRRPHIPVPTNKVSLPNDCNDKRRDELIPQTRHQPASPPESMLPQIPPRPGENE